MCIVLVFCLLESCIVLHQQEVCAINEKQGVKTDFPRIYGHIIFLLITFIIFIVSSMSFFVVHNSCKITKQNIERSKVKN